MAELSFAFSFVAPSTCQGGSKRRVSEGAESESGWSRSPGGGIRGLCEVTRESCPMQA